MKVKRLYPVLQVDMKYTEHYIAKELKAKGFETIFITSDKYLESWKHYLDTKDGPGVYQYKDYKLHRLSAWFPLGKPIFKNWKKLKKVLYNDEDTIYHFYSLGSFSTILGLYLSLSKLSPRSIIISDHTDNRTHTRDGFSSKLYYIVLRILLSPVRKQIKSVVVFGLIGEKILSSRYSIERERFKIIPLGYNQDIYYYQPSLKNTDQKFIIGFAGKVDSKKRVHVLIEALQKSSIADEVKLIIVGFKNDNYGKKLKELAVKGSVEIEFRPFADSLGLSNFYNYIDLAVFPGGISITTIEASGCGCPVIIYKSIPNLEERVKNGRGKLFSTELEMIKHIDFYVKNREIDRERIAMVTKETNSWEKISNQYEEIYKN